MCCLPVLTGVLQAVQLVPALPTRLLPMLVQNMPHKLRDRSAQCLYLCALISLCEGKVGPALREGLLGGLVEHLLALDADIRWEDIVDAPTGMFLFDAGLLGKHAGLGQKPSYGPTPAWPKSSYSSVQTMC